MKPVIPASLASQNGITKLMTEKRFSLLFCNWSDKQMIVQSKPTASAEDVQTDCLHILS